MAHEEEVSIESLDRFIEWIDDFAEVKELVAAAITTGRNLQPFPDDIPAIAEEVALKIFDVIDANPKKQGK